MIATNYSDARQRLAHFCDEAVNNVETIVVTRKNKENVVIMSEAEYNNILENLYIRSDRHNYERLLESIDQLKRGNGKRHELVSDNE